MRTRSKRKGIVFCIKLVCLLMLIIAYPFAGKDTGAIHNPPLYLIYDVTYAGGKIATVEFTESKPYIYNGEPVRELECRIESSGLFNLNGIYRSVVADDYSVVYFRSDEGQPGNRRIIEYHFDYKNRSATVIDNKIKGVDTTVSTYRYRDINQKYFDTVSMIFKIRHGVDTLGAPVYMPLFMNGRQDSVLIESVNDVQHIGPRGETIDAYLIKARLPYSPYPGFRDRIEIYISKDGDHLPLRGRIQMALGYMEIKLRSQ